jgi:hypothetical protein
VCLPASDQESRRRSIHSDPRRCEFDKRKSIGYNFCSNWHEEAEEEISRDEILVVAFLFYGRIFLRSRTECEAGAFFLVNGFLMPQARRTEQRRKGKRNVGLGSNPLQGIN